MVAYDASLHVAGRPSTFRTGLAGMTGPRWYGVSSLLPAYLTPQQARLTVQTSDVLPTLFCSRQS